MPRLHAARKYVAGVRLGDCKAIHIRACAGRALFGKRTTADTGNTSRTPNPIETSNPNSRTNYHTKGHGSIVP